MRGLLAPLAIGLTAVAIAGGGCGGEAASGTTSDNTGRGDTRTREPTTATTTGTETETSGTETGDGETTDSATTTTPPPPPPVGNLVASPDNVRCYYVPDGALGGGDLLAIAFYILLIGATPNELPTGVTHFARSDTGLTSRATGGVSNQAARHVQLTLRPSDFGRTHAVTIEVDEPKAISETDETDNRIRVVVSMPAPRPSAAIHDLHCSAVPA